MSETENSFAAVIELAEREHDSCDEECHVRRGDDHFRTPADRLLSQLVHEIFRIVQMLDQIHQQDLVELREVRRQAWQRRGGHPVS